MPEHASRRALAASVLLSAVLIATTLALFDPFFTNDGAVMAMIASGTGVALRPDEHLVFTNVLLGRLVAGLYRRAPDVPWYGLHMVGVQAIAWTGLFHASLVRGVTARRVARCVLAYAVVGLGLLVNLQFSSTAFLVAMAGGCLWMGTTGARGWGAAAGAVALMVTGSLERFDPFLLVLALAGLGAVLAAGGWPGRRFLAVGASATLLALGARAYDDHVYGRDAGWASFREFIPLLPEITDYGRASTAGPELDAALARAGWSANDHRLFMQWFHADAEVYGADALRRLLAEAPETTPLQRIRGGVERLGRVAANPALWAMLLALPWLLGSRPGPRRLVVVACLLLAALLATLLLAAFRKSAPQVYLPLFALPLCVALSWDEPSGPARPPRGREATLLLLAAAGVALSAAHQHREGRDEREQARALWSRYQPLARSPEQLVVAWFNAFPFEVVRPLEGPGRLRALRLFSIGWSQRTPLARDVLASFGSTDLIESLSDPRTILLAPPTAPPLLALFAEEHRAQRLRFTPEQTAPFAAFRARVVAPTAIGAAERR